MRVRGSGALIATAALVAATWAPTALAQGAAANHREGPHAQAMHEQAMESGGGSERELDERDIAGDATVSLVEAIDAALAAQPGSAVEAGLEAEVDDEGTDFFYEIMVVGRDGGLYEVLVDPRSGQVRVSDDESDGEEMEELVGFQRALRYSDRTLAEISGSAATVARGVAVSAELEMEHGGPEADVLFVNGRYLIEVGIEARAGQVIEIELEGLGEESEHPCACAAHGVMHR